MLVHFSFLLFFAFSVGGTCTTLTSAIDTSATSVSGTSNVTPTSDSETDLTDLVTPTQPEIEVLQLTLIVVLSVSGFFILMILIVVPVVITRKRQKRRRPESGQNLADYHSGRYPGPGPGYAPDPRVMNNYVAFTDIPAVRSASGPDLSGRAVLYDDRYDEPNSTANIWWHI